MLCCNFQTVQLLLDLPTWDARLEYIIEGSEDSNVAKIDAETLSTLKYYIEEVASYSQSKSVIASTAHLLRPSGSSKYDPCGLNKVKHYYVIINSFRQQLHIHVLHT